MNWAILYVSNPVMTVALNLLYCHTCSLCVVPNVRMYAANYPWPQKSDYSFDSNAVAVVVSACLAFGSFCLCQAAGIL